MSDKFKNYNLLKGYLKVVAKDNKLIINIDDFSGLENIFVYLLKYRNRIKYNFLFSEWTKLVRQNNIEELKRISDIGNFCIKEKGEK